MSSLQPVNSPLDDVREKMRVALAARAVKAVSELADTLRFRFRMNYEQTMRFCEALGTDREEVEAMFYEAETDNE